jgi:hypothetical protein
MADHVGLGQSRDKRCVNDTLIAREQGPPEHLCRRDNDPVSRVAMEPDGKRCHRCRHRRSDAETLNQRGRRGRFQPFPQGELQGNSTEGIQRGNFPEADIRDPERCGSAGLPNHLRLCYREAWVSTEPV